MVLLTIHLEPDWNASQLAEGIGKDRLQTSNRFEKHIVDPNELVSFAAILSTSKKEPCSTATSCRYPAQKKAGM